MIGNEKITMLVTIQRMSNTQRRLIRLRKEILRSSFLQNATVRVARFPVEDLSDYLLETCTLKFQYL